MMNNENAMQWKSGEIFQNDEFAEIYAKHRKYEVTKILGNTCFLIKRPFLGIVKANVYFCEGDANELIDECYRLVKEKHIPFIGIRTSIAKEAFAHFPCKQGGTYVIDLREDIEVLFKRVQKRARQYIKKAPEKGVRVEIANNIEDFDRWWDVYMSTVNRKSFTFEDYDLARELFLHENLSRLFVVKINGEIACGCFLHCGYNTVIHWISGTNKNFSEIASGYHLRWKMIEWAKEQGFSYYDMGGALLACYDESGELIDTGKGEGPSAFKKKFGGEYKEVYDYRIIRNKFKYKIISTVIKARFKLIKHL